MRRRTTLKAMLAVLMLGLSLGATACSDDGNDPPNPPDPDGPPPEVPASAVLIAERVQTQTERFYYVSVQAQVPTAAVDRSKALEFTSADIEVYEKHIYIRDRQANTITRYRVTVDLELEQVGEKLSFATTGLGTGRYHNVYLSASQAYTLDAGSWRLIGWNPTTMLLTGQIISIDNMRKAGLTGGGIGVPTQVGSRIIAPIYWANFTPQGIPTYYRGSGAIILDPLLPTQPAFAEDSRLGGAYRISAGSDGAYMIGVADGVVGSSFGGGPPPASGILRIPDGVNAFDTNYFVNVGALTGSPSIWSIHRIDATTVLAQIFDPAMAVPPLQEYVTSTNFIYVRINTQTGMVTPVSEIPRGGRGNAGNHVVDGKLYIQLSNATGSETFAVSGSGITPAFPIPAGDLWHLQRIR